MEQFSTRLRKLGFDEKTIGYGLSLECRAALAEASGPQKRNFGFSRRIASREGGRGGGILYPRFRLRCIKGLPVAGAR
jgi:hypothetical protein